MLCLLLCDISLLPVPIFFFFKFYCLLKEEWKVGCVRLSLEGDGDRVINRSKNKSKLIVSVDYRVGGLKAESGWVISDENYAQASTPNLNSNSHQKKRERERERETEMFHFPDGSWITLDRRGKKKKKTLELEINKRMSKRTFPR